MEKMSTELERLNVTAELYNTTCFQGQEKNEGPLYEQFRTSFKVLRNSDIYFDIIIEDFLKGELNFDYTPHVFGLLNRNIVEFLRHQRLYDTEIKYLTGTKSVVPPSQLCRVCFDETLQIVTLPCNHLVSCLNCAYRDTECSLCGQTILKRYDVINLPASVVANRGFVHSLQDLCRWTIVEEGIDYSVFSSTYLTDYIHRGVSKRILVSVRVANVATGDTTEREGTDVLDKEKKKKRRSRKCMIM